MTTQLRLTTATALPLAKATSKATNDPADQTADQFAAMFAALCFAPLPQPQPKPAVKTQETAPVIGITNSEIQGFDSARESPTPVITLQTPTAVSGKEAQAETTSQGAALPFGPPGPRAALLSSEQTLNGLAGSAGILPASFAATHEAGKTPALPRPSLQREATAPSSISRQMEEMTQPVPMTAIPPAAKIQSAAPAYSTANPEILDSDSDRESRTPVIILQTLTAGSDKEAPPEMAAQGAALPFEPPGPPATWFSSEQTLNSLAVWSTQRKTQAETTPATETVEPASGGSAGILPASFVATHEAGKMSALPAAVIQYPRFVINDNLADQTSKIEAARRQSGLVAGYPGKATPNDPEVYVAAAVKTLSGGNGFDLRGDDREGDSGFDSRLPFSTLSGEVSFAATVRDLQSNGGASSIQSQTISQILAQAETLPGRQTRSLRLRLRPEELGEIDIQLSRDAAGRISAHISAERASARVALSQSLDQLRETLSRAGLTVDKLQISAESGPFAGNRGTDNARSNTGESTSVVANLLTENEMEASGQSHAEDEKLLSLHA